MRTLLRLIQWFGRAWPVIVIVLVICGHFLLLDYFSQSNEFINKTASLLAQLAGGFLILYSIDSNIGIMNEKSLHTMLKNYFKEFPLIKKSVVVELKGLEVTVSAGKLKVVVERNPQSIDEKIQYLQEQIDQLKRQLEQESKELNMKIERQSEEINAQIQNAKSTLRIFEDKMVEVSTGGIKVQLFGILLMVYGAFAGYFA